MATPQIPVGTVHINEMVSPIFQATLYNTTIWKPGISFTNKWDSANVGTIYINKLDRTAIDPKAPTGKFTDVEQVTTQVPLRINNQFDYSTEVNNVTVSQVAANTNLLGKATEQNMKSNIEDNETSMTAAVVNEGTTSAVTTVVDKTNVRDIVTKEREDLLNNSKVSPTFIIVTPSVHTAMLLDTTASFFPQTNEKLMNQGIVGNYLGLTVLEYSGFNNASAKYLDFADALQDIDLTKVEFIMSHPDYLAQAASFKLARAIEDKNLAGVFAQLMSVSGYRIPTADRVTIKTHL